MTWIAPEIIFIDLPDKENLIYHEDIGGVAIIKIKYNRN